MTRVFRWALDIDRSELQRAWLGHDWLDPTWVWFMRVVAGRTSNGRANLGIPCSRLGWSMTCSREKRTVSAITTREGSWRPKNDDAKVVWGRRPVKWAFRVKPAAGWHRFMHFWGSFGNSVGWAWSEVTCQCQGWPDMVWGVKIEGKEGLIGRGSGEKREKEKKKKKERKRERKKKEKRKEKFRVCSSSQNPLSRFSKMTFRFCVF